MTGVLVALLVVEVGLPLLAFLLRDRLMFFPSAAPRARVRRRSWDTEAIAGRASPRKP